MSYRHGGLGLFISVFFRVIGRLSIEWFISLDSLDVSNTPLVQLLKDFLYRKDHLFYCPVFKKTNLRFSDVILLLRLIPLLDNILER